jgi:uncharacterized membrane protein YdjX (TVP38/TMEM64 family)
MKQHGKPILLAIMVVTMLVAIALLPVSEWLALGIVWIEARRALAWFVYLATYIIATVLVVPVSILTLAAGYLFGFPLGVVLASVGSILGASGAFLVGRFFIRDWVAKRIADLPRFRALDQATRHEGFLIVFLTRLSPLFPFNLINYGLALTSVRFRDYFFASWLGMLPVTTLYTYVGSVAKNLTDLTSGGLQGSGFSRTLVLVGLAASAVLTVLVTRKATRTLSQHLAREPTEQEDAP